MFVHAIWISCHELEWSVYYFHCAVIVLLSENYPDVHHCFSFSLLISESNKKYPLMRYYH